MTEQLDELKKFAHSFQKYLNYSLAEFIEHILSYSHLPTKAEIAKDLGIPPYELSRRLNLLKRLNFMFDINIDLHALGLSRMLIIARSNITEDNLENHHGRPYLNFYSPILLPFNGTLLMYYLPQGCDPNIFLSHIDNIVMYDFIEETLYTKAKLTKHFNFVSRTYDVRWDSLHEVVHAYLNKSKTVEVDVNEVVKRYTRVKYDSLDLLIIKELEKDPFKPLSEIAEALGVDYAKVLRHYSQHVSKIVRGFKLRAVPLPPEASLYVFIVIRCDNILSKALANALSELMQVCAIYLSPRSMYALVVCDQKFLNELLKFLNTYTNNYEIYLLDRSRRRAYTIPYTEYSKFHRSWLLRWS